MDKIVARGPTVEHPLDGKVIAGTAVGVLLAVALLAFCLYPVIVYRLNQKRKYVGRYPQAESGLDIGGPAHGSIHHENLSSNDSTKQKGVSDNTPHPRTDGEISFWPGLDRGCGGIHNGLTCAGAEFHAQQALASRQYDGSQSLMAEPASSLSFEYYAGPLPVFPQAVPHVPYHEITLKGTSEDYYSPDIPSEAFGMYTTPPPVSRLALTDHNTPQPYSILNGLGQLFQRKSSKDDAGCSYASASRIEEQGYGAHLGGVASQQQTGETQSTTDWPIVDLPTQGDSILNIHNSTTVDHIAAGDIVKHQQSAVYASLQNHFAPPSLEDGSHIKQYAPETVNPMDIMPASTESELGHRTDHQLFAMIQEKMLPYIPSDHAVPPSNDDIRYSPSPLLPAEFSLSTESAYDTMEKQESTQGKHMAQGDTVDDDGCTQPSSRPGQPSVPTPNSDEFKGQVLALPMQDPTAVSMTFLDYDMPSSQTDGPSLPSPESTDFRSSTSPPSAAESEVRIRSSRGFIYRCDQPGCNQVFDQSHKLKHHQRYHSKDHKCPFPNCGKGFGTKTHLQRHINDRHEKKRKFHCAIHGCDYSKAGGKAFPRKDNWKRHMTKIHGADHQTLPQPIEVDQDMT